MRNITVVTTGCGAKYTPAFYDCLRANGERNIRVAGTDMSADRTALQLVDVFYQVPMWKDPDYIDVLLDICKKEKADVILPTMSGELLPLIDRKAEFEAIGTKVAVSNRKSVEIATDKYRFYEFLREKGFKVPQFAPVRCADDLEAACMACGYPDRPVCVKAVNLSGSRGVRIIKPGVSRYDLLFGEKPGSFYTTMEELLSTLREKPAMPLMMAMEYLPGTEGSVDLLAENGRVLYGAYRETTVNLHSIPQEAALVDNPEALDIAARVVKALDYTGNADFDFKKDSEGHPVLMELNPRVAATMKLFMKGGLNLPYLRIKHLLGEPLPEIKIKYGTKMVRRYLEMFDPE